MSTETESLIWKHVPSGKYLVLKPKGGFSTVLTDSLSFDIDKAYIGYDVPYRLRSTLDYVPIKVIVKRTVEIKVNQN